MIEVDELLVDPQRNMRFVKIEIAHFQQKMVNKDVNKLDSFWSRILFQEVYRSTCEHMCLLLRLRKMMAVKELVGDDEMSVDDDVSLKKYLLVK